MSRAGTAVVFGATGNVGFGAAIGLLDAGLRVVAPTRDEGGASKLRAAFAGRELHPVVGDISDPDDATRLVSAILDAHGAPDHVVASMGPWWQGGGVAGQTPAEWARVRGMLLDGHVNAAALLLPVLARRERGSYTVITGMGAMRPMPGTSLLFVATNGVLALSRTLREEHDVGPTRVNEVLIGTRIEKAARPGVVPSAVFGRAVAAVVASDVRGQVLRYDAPATFSLS